MHLQEKLDCFLLVLSGPRWNKEASLSTFQIAVLTQILVKLSFRVRSLLPLLISCFFLFFPSRSTTPAPRSDQYRGRSQEPCGGEDPIAVVLCEHHFVFLNLIIKSIFFSGVVWVLDVVADVHTRGRGSRVGPRKPLRTRNRFRVIRFHDVPSVSRDAHRR